MFSPIFKITIKILCYTSRNETFDASILYSRAENWRTVLSCKSVIKNWNTNFYEVFQIRMLWNDYMHYGVTIYLLFGEED